MQILLNELSLSGQFADTATFIKNGLLPMIAVLKEMQAFSALSLAKKSDVWNYMVTPSSTLHGMLIGNEFRKSDELRRLKSVIVRLTDEPFWDVDSKQDTISSYFVNGVNVSGSSVAEAVERDKALASFLRSSISANPLKLLKDGEPMQLLNLTRSGELTEYLWASQQISFEAYMKSSIFSVRFGFSELRGRLGFEAVQADEQALFIDAFKKFMALTWDQIYIDQGLNYKQYGASISAEYRGVKTYKFRVSGKMRCHGYREEDIFVVIGFETDHSLSDRG